MAFDTLQDLPPEGRCGLWQELVAQGVPKADVQLLFDALFWVSPEIVF